MDARRSAQHVDLILARELSRMLPDDPAARQGAARGELRRIRRGVYVPTAQWEALPPADRYRAVCRGLSLSRANPPVLCHWSAAYLWNLPILIQPPSEVHLVVQQGGGRARNGVRGHALALAPGDIQFLDGVPVTSLRRTVLDLAATADVYTAIAILDHVVHVDRFGALPPSLTKGELLAALDDAGALPGRRRAAVRIAFADERSGSPAESASRTTMALIGIPEPELQRSFDCESGRYESDFYWGEVDGIGEVDGKSKYLDPAFRAGMTAEQVVYREKVREDELRRRVARFARWDPATGRNHDRLRSRLAEIGLHAGRPRLPAW
jgi:hypothetical protein